VLGSTRGRSLELVAKALAVLAMIVARASTEEGSSRRSTQVEAGPDGGPSSG